MIGQMKEPTVVVFDLGEVLVTPTDLNSHLAARVACDPEKFRTAYWARRLEYDLGLDADEYWIDLLDELGIPTTQSVIQDLIDIDSVGWTTLRADALALLQLLHSNGHRIVILSNGTHEMALAARNSPWASLVDKWFFSAELGMAKPGLDIYETVGRQLGAAPPEIHYLEDSTQSVETARRAGWHTHHWTNPDRAWEFLAARELI